MIHTLERVDDWERLAREARYSPRELAHLCHISLRTLERHFKKNYRVTVTKWLKNLRLQAAYHKLLAGKSVKEVAFDLDYKQLSHFSRDFKVEFGLSPSAVHVRIEPKAGSYSAKQESPSSPQLMLSF